MDADPQNLPPEDVSANKPDSSTLTAQRSNYERWSKLPKTRGRQPRDPNAQSVRFQCRTIDDLERQLREYLEAPSLPAENTTVEFLYPVSAAFMVYAADFRSREENRAHGKQHEHLYGKLDRCAVSVIDALAQNEDPKHQMRRQKAIAKVCVEACEKVDGFRYSFHNHWLSREDEACRFSYFCNDSTLNKGRAANEGAGTSGKRMRKPVYDCQGLIAVKFSHTKQSLEIHYKHVSLHKTYVERAPPPRRDSKRYKLLEVFDPESLPQKRSRKRQSEDEESTKPSRNRGLKDPNLAEGMEDKTDARNQDGLQSLVHFLDSANGPTNVETAAPQHNDEIGRNASFTPDQSLVSSEAPRGTLQQQKTNAIVDIPGIVTDSLQDENDTWRSNALAKEVSTKKSKRKTATSRLRGSVETSSSAVPKSEFEMLKAKLEEAEQRIRKLESEKSQPAQPWPGPSYPFPPPSQYPYPYPPPYPYPSVGYQPSYPQAPYPGPALPQNTTSAAAQTGVGFDLRPLQPGTTAPARSFVPYTYASQDPMSDQRPKAIRPLVQATSAPDIVAVSSVGPAPSTPEIVLDRHN